MRSLKNRISHLRHPLAIALGASAVVAASVTWPGLALAPETWEHPVLSQLKNIRSVTQLNRLQSRIDSELDALPPRWLIRDSEKLQPYFRLLQVQHQLAQRATLEAEAEARFKRAKELAIQGLSSRDAGREDDEESLEELRQQEYLWESAIQQLNQIPEASMLATKAAHKREAYNDILTPVAENIDVLQSDFLVAIAAKTPRPEAIRITICHLTGECRDYQGDVPPASPASLIKLPIAVVLMHKVTTEEDVDLDAIVYIDPHNWTENANGAKIFVRNEYSLREVMVRMIKESNNIATNQLIDYLGWDYLNETLTELGYETTQVRTKLVGERTYPTRNRAIGSNTMTTNDVTEMMRQIYTFTNPGDDEILDGMVGQYDWDFGYLAVRKLRNKRAAWIGEKTGQNSKVIGSSMAVKIDNERYVVTVTIDHTAKQETLRQVIGDVVQAILDDGHLVEPARRSSEAL